MVSGFIRGCFDHLPGLVDRLVGLVRGHQQVAFHFAQVGDFPETHLRRIERYQRHYGASLLFVERRHDTVVVGVVRMCLQQLAVDVQRLVVPLCIDECLTVELVVPLVRRIEPVSLAGQLHRFVRGGVKSVCGQFVVGRGIGRIAAYGLPEKSFRAHRVAEDGILLDPLGIEPHAAQRVGPFGSGRCRRVFPGDEGRGREQAQNGGRC